MEEKLKIFLAVLPVAIVVLLLLIFLRRCCCNRRSRTRNIVQIPIPTTRTESLQSGLAKLHLSYTNPDPKALSTDPSEKRKQKPNYYVIRRGVLAEPLFNWADHPRLITEAAENGWSRFAFASLPPSLPRSKSVWEFCAVCNYEGEADIEIGWEVSSGSSDCMQKVRLRPRSKKNALDFSFVRMELPLPGPLLGNSSFPQEAYFEITILPGEEGDVAGEKRDSVCEGEQVKLISETAMKAQSDSLVHVNCKNCNNDELKKKKMEETKENEGASLISLGLVGGGFPPFKPPGSYPGSIGFNSNGSVYLDGIKLVFEAEEGDWSGANKVIGCGFDPSQKRVFFTVDSKIAHVIHCKPDEFGSPLYPTLASNFDVTVLVNLGQTIFKYGPANPHRTPNPCFFRPDSSSPALRIGYEEDSRELFSMGRIDSKWLGSRNKNGYENGENVDGGVESEIDDLFEIVLDDRNKSR